MTEENRDKLPSKELHPDRDILFSNEAFVIGVLQAVSGGSLVAALAQSEAIIKLSSKMAFLVFLTIMVVALLAAVLAAFWKHQYKMWDIKRNGPRASNYLAAMRRALIFSVGAILVGFSMLVGSFWFP